MWTQHFIDTERGRFEYFLAGQGEPMAITHMYMAFDTRGNLMATPFAEHYQVYLINIRNAGGSIKSDSDDQLGMKEFVKDVEAIREALQIERWAFAGHSTGGMMALQYAVTAPTSLTKIIAGCTAASKAYAGHPDSIYCAENKHFTRIVEIMDLLNSVETPQEERQQLSYEWALMSYYSEEKLQEAIRRPNSGRTVGENLHHFRKIDVRNFDLRTALTNVDVPTYVYAGRYDAQCPVEFSYEIAELIPQSQLTIFEQSNHNPYIEEEEEEKFKVFVRETV
ncbi:alpha/beta fold hydrolase [Lysinibacillus piscis]|uniref:Proline iminopeptidase n=1 Tax=Lysinibacillus piscis TaxID=2518931 RepID=A0ABQ5NI39_9BACI|nr:alpha/beta hydrolase [Lysinibacillus sp. KH24]GLC88017.1 proline iminopeptidase [Lysinibacillus sp. KH24]